MHSRGHEAASNLFFPPPSPSLLKDKSRISCERFIPTYPFHSRVFVNPTIENCHAKLTTALLILPNAGWRRENEKGSRCEFITSTGPRSRAKLISRVCEIVHRVTERTRIDSRYCSLRSTLVHVSLVSNILAQTGETIVGSRFVRSCIRVTRRYIVQERHS